MSLYDDEDYIKLPEEPKEEPKAQSSSAQPKDEEKKVSISSTNLTFLKAQLESKRAQIQFKVKPPTIGPSMLQMNQIQSSLGPPPAKKPATASLLKPRRVQPLKIDASTTFSIIPKALKEDKVFLFNEIFVEDEYNPTTPTDYYSFKAKREAQLARERIAREVAERLEKEYAEEIAKRSKGANIAPPSSLLMESSDFEPPQIETIPKKDVVSNMMNRMGWKGYGLGKDQQGISSALQIKKIGKSTGMIIHEPKTVPENVAGRSESPPPINITELLKNASKIVLVKNMVSTTDVDSELKTEITEEMTKYGQVEDVVIYLVENSTDNKVRVFVKFTNQAQAIKAVIDLNKRFFNGRAIRATFYNFDDFEAKEYNK